MAIAVFPDTCLFMNFAAARRMDLLEAVVSGNGRWTRAVMDEVIDFSTEPDFVDLTAALRFMGDALNPTPAERIDTQIIRDVFAGPGDGPHKHLGESETFSIAESRFFDHRVLILTEDAAAITYCTDRTGLTPVTTKDVLSLGVRAGAASTDEANEVAAKMRDFGRPVRGFPPKIGP